MKVQKAGLYIGGRCAWHHWQYGKDHPLSFWHTVWLHFQALLQLVESPICCLQQNVGDYVYFFIGPAHKHLLLQADWSDKPESNLEICVNDSKTTISLVCKWLKWRVAPTDEYLCWRVMWIRIKRPLCWSIKCWVCRSQFSTSGQTEEKMRPRGKNLEWGHYVPVSHHWLSAPRPTFSALLKSQWAGSLQTTFRWFSGQLSPRKILPIGRREERKQCCFLFKCSAFSSASSSNGGSCKFQKR